MTTTVISSQSFGTSTNVGDKSFAATATLQGNSKYVIVTAEVTTTNNAAGQSVIVRYATSPVSYSAAAAPWALAPASRFVKLELTQQNNVLSRSSLYEPIAGQYFYVWVEAPTLSTAATISVYMTETSDAGGAAFNASASFTRPNDTNAYTALDVLSDSTSAPTVLTFASIGPTAGKVILTRATLEIDVSAIPSGMGAFRIHLYNASPTAINDNAAYDLPSGDRTKYLGFIEIPTPYDLGSTLWADTEAMFQPIRMEIQLVTSSIYGIPQTVAGYTPTASVVKKINLFSLGV